MLLIECLIDTAALLEKKKNKSLLEGAFQNDREYISFSNKWIFQKFPANIP